MVTGAVFGPSMGELPRGTFQTAFSSSAGFGGGASFFAAASGCGAALKFSFTIST